MFHRLLFINTFLDVKSSGELLIWRSDSSVWDGDDDPGGEGDGEHLVDVSDLWMLLLFLNSCSFGCCCLFIFRKTRSEVCWLGLLEGGELVDSRLNESSFGLLLFIGEDDLNLEISCSIKNITIILIYFTIKRLIAFYMVIYGWYYSHSPV